MPSNEFSAQNEELLNQSVSDAELKEILERIGHEDFGGNPQTTVRDIAEGTSADPAIIGRILGDIRKEDWEERFGLKLKDHDERIESLESKPNQAPTVIHHYHEVPVPKQGHPERSEAKPTSYTPPVRRSYGYGSSPRQATFSTWQFFVASILVFAIVFVLQLMCSKMP